MFRDEMIQQWRQEHPVSRSEGMAISLIRIKGKDRLKFLQGFTTNDMKSLTRGEYAETFILNIKGKILGHGLVLAEEEGLIFIGTAGQQEKLIVHLDRYIITEDVKLMNESDLFTNIFLVGELPADLLKKLGMNEEDRMSEKQHQKKMISTQEVHLVNRLDYCMPVLQIIFRKSAEAMVLDVFELKKLKSSEFNLLRILSGQPIYGRDISEDNLGQECSRTAHAISFHKGCYLGQEPIARIDALGHVNQKLRILSWQTSDVRDLNQTSLPITLTDPDTQKGLGMISSFERWNNSYTGLGVIKRHVAERETSFHAKLETGEELKIHVDWINAE